MTAGTAHEAACRPGTRDAILAAMASMDDQLVATLADRYLVLREIG